MAIGLFAGAAPTQAAVFSNLVEQGKIVNSGQVFHTLSGQRDMTPAQHIRLGVLGDDAVSSLSLAGSQGMMRLNAHSCSGPPLGANAGSANATGQLYYEEDFVIRSAKLPDGTDALPFGAAVTIDIRIAAGNSFIATTTNPNNLPTFDSAGVQGSANIRIDSNLTGEATFIGSFSGGQQGGFPSSRTETGIFGTPVGGDPTEQGERRADEFIATVGGKVGQRFNIAVTAALSTGSNAGYFSVSDADGQISLLWGFSVVGGLAEIRTNGDNFLAPSTSNATADRALIFLPVSPLAPVPEPGSLALMGGAGLVLLRRRRA